MIELTQKLVQDRYNYNPETGDLTYKSTSNNQVRIGDIVGSIHKTGYRVTKFNSISYKVHRLIWLFVYGYTPDYIDHKDHNRDNNRLNNLRTVTVSNNAKNRIPYCTNTSGYPGISWVPHSHKWSVRIGVNGKRIYLGVYTLFSDVLNIKKKAERKYNYHPNHNKILQPNQI